MRHVVGATCGLWVALAAPLQADPAVVVELYTSQGCASCPPADAFFETLVDDPRVIPLALHVDYWDYIGWADSFANPAFTARQKAYARASGSRMIYTPQMIIAGEDRVEGLAPDEFATSVTSHLARPSRVKLTVERKGEVITIHAEADPPLTKPVRVQLVRYLPSEVVEIQRGENAGQVITYRNIVTSWDVLGDWPGTEELDVSAAAPGAAPAVVIVQEQGPGAILAAARAE